MAKIKHISPTTVQVEIGGKEYSGSYTLESGIVTAEWDGWTDKTQAGASAEATARQLVRELVRKHRP